jgi:hypothetical protein
MAENRGTESNVNSNGVEEYKVALVLSHLEIENLDGRVPRILLEWDVPLGFPPYPRRRDAGKPNCCPTWTVSESEGLENQKFRSTEAVLPRPKNQAGVSHACIVITGARSCHATIEEGSYEVSRSCQKW